MNEVGNPTQGRVDAQTGSVSLESLKGGTADLGFVAINPTRAVDVVSSQPYLLGWRA